MDLALAIWQLNPAAEFVLSADHSSIAIWRGPGPQPSADELAIAWAAYQAAQPLPPPSLNEQLAGALAALPADQPITGVQLAEVIALLRGPQS
jgi:hypothetical protein